MAPSKRRGATSKKNRRKIFFIFADFGNLFTASAATKTICADAAPGVAEGRSGSACFS
jgi:hypothetical protein